MISSAIVNGEASETESEDEQHFKSPIVSSKLIKGALVHGEDTESEDDGSVSSAASILKTETSQPTIPQYDSLLHDKLRENNANLQKDLNNFCVNTVQKATNILNDTEQKLLQSQITIQSAVSSLRTLGNNSASIKNKLQSVLTCRFIPNMKINK